MAGFLFFLAVYGIQLSLFYARLPAIGKGEGHSRHMFLPIFLPGLSQMSVHLPFFFDGKDNDNEV